jgi:hypothetical protein
MPDQNSNLHDVISQGNVPEIHSKILASDFILISTSKEGETDDDNIGALTAELEEVEVLVAFTTEANAKIFVDAMAEFFTEDESVDGIVVDGAAMLDYMPEGYGLLLDAELEINTLMAPNVTAEVLALQT